MCWIFVRIMIKFQVFSHTVLKAVSFFNWWWTTVFAILLVCIKMRTREYGQKESQKGGIQQLRGQNFAIFWLPYPCVDNFYTLSVDKNRHFLTPSPPHLVHLVIEWPFNIIYYFVRPNIFKLRPSSVILSYRRMTVQRNLTSYDVQNCC